MPLSEWELLFVQEIHLTGKAPHFPMIVRKAGRFVDDAGKVRSGRPCEHMRRWFQTKRIGSMLHSPKAVKRR